MYPNQNKRNPLIEILIEGYCYSEDPDGKSERACSTVSLVIDQDLKIISDPGSMANPDDLIKKLRKRGLTTKDIDMVFISHSHLDHYKYVGLFPDAKVLDYWGLWEGDRCRSGVRTVNKNISVVDTPGHTFDSITLLVNTNKGVVAICGDVFWEKDLPELDRFASDLKQLRKSRKLLLTCAHYIIPGHGGIFETSLNRDNV